MLITSVISWFFPQWIEMNGEPIERDFVLYLIISDQKWKSTAPEGPAVSKLNPVSAPRGGIYPVGVNPTRAIDCSP